MDTAQNDSARLMSILIDENTTDPHPGSTSRPSPENPQPASPPGRGWLGRRGPPTQPRTRIPAVKQAARDLRTRSTPSEQMLWVALRGNRLAGLKFRRQHPMGRFVLDFYCPEKRLAVEIDGEIHQARNAADEERQKVLESMGIRFIRLRARVVEENISAAIERIRHATVPIPLAHSTGEGSREARG